MDAVRTVLTCLPDRRSEDLVDLLPFGLTIDSTALWR